MPRFLLDRFPELKKNLPWIELADLPTPVRRLTNVEEATGLKQLWIKNDNLSSTLYGGNKVRKFEFLLAEVIKRGCNEMITAGGAGSNHAVATSLFGGKLKIPVTVVCSPQPNLTCVKNNILVNLFCDTKIISVPTEALMGTVIGGYWLWSRLVAGRRPYFIYFGGSTPVGTVGFVNAALELAAQVEAGELPEPKYIFLPTGSCGTQAGLEIGLRLSGLKTQVVGVRIVSKLVTNRYMVALLARRTVRFIRKRCPEFPKIKVPVSEVLILDDYFGGQYGKPTPEGKEAIKLAAEKEGVQLDPTYSGKAFAGLLDWSKKQGHQNEPLLFWQTYNSRDLAGYLDQNQDLTKLPASLQEYFNKDLADPEL